MNLEHREIVMPPYLQTTTCTGVLYDIFDTLNWKGRAELHRLWFKATGNSGMLQKNGITTAEVLYCNVASTYDSGTPVKMQYDVQVHLCSFLKSRVGPEGFQTGEYTCSCSLWYFTDHFQSWNQFIDNKINRKKLPVDWHVDPCGPLIITRDMANIVAAVPVYALWLCLPY